MTDESKEPQVPPPAIVGSIWQRPDGSVTVNSPPMTASLSVPTPGIHVKSGGAAAKLTGGGTHTVTFTADAVIVDPPPATGRVATVSQVGLGTFSVVAVFADPATGAVWGVSMILVTTILMRAGYWDALIAWLNEQLEPR